jgi:hypothetical protein
MTTLATDILTELIGKKHELLVQLRDAGRRQMELIEASDMTQLLKLLSSKQRVLTSLQDVERRLDPYRSQNPEQRVWRTAADRERCSRVSANCELLLAEVVEGERRGEARLTAHRDRAAAQLELVQHASQARAAYADMTPGSGYSQLDLSSES